MKIKTSNVVAVERGRPVSDNSDIELIGSESLHGCDDSLTLAVQNKLITNKSHCFCKVFGFDCKFYYSISISERYEVGIGYLEKNKKKIFLKRPLPLFYSDNGVDVIPSYNVPRIYASSESEYIIVSSYTPRTYLELLPDPNSIIVSIDSFVPSSLHVDKNSVVARLGGNITSLSLTDLFKTEEFKEAVKDITQ